MKKFFSLISVILFLISGCTERINEQCSIYERDGEELDVCAQCGDGICEEFERCTPSSCDQDYCTRDCGQLYCPEDCEK